MKNTIITTIILFVTLSANAQLANWKSILDNKNLVYLNTGYSFGLTNQIGYAYKINSARNIYLNTDFSAPMGENLLDDFKYRLGGQLLLKEKNNFLLSGKLNLVYKKTETNLVTMSNLGFETGVTIGFYRERWHAAVELNYDHAMLANLKHSESMKKDFVDLTDGWYGNAAGNVFLGIQASKSIGQALDLNLRLGAVKSKFQDVNPLLPMDAQVGLSYAFR